MTTHLFRGCTTFKEAEQRLRAYLVQLLDDSIRKAETDVLLSGELDEHGLDGLDESFAAARRDGLAAIDRQIPEAIGWMKTYIHVTPTA